LSNAFTQSRLAELVTGPDAWLTPWTKAAALYAIGHTSIAEVGQPGNGVVAEAVVAALNTPESLVREMATWALFWLDPTLYDRYRQQLEQDLSPQVVKVVKQLIREEPGNGANKWQGSGVMITTVEKVIRLKSMDFFAETSEEVLVNVAAALEEVEVEEGETFLKKGDLGSSLYLIVDGRVQVHDGERAVAELGENEILGELALLDPAPRSAAVTALTDSRLFRLDQAPFYELLEDHSEVARSLLQILARRIRHTSAQARPGHASTADFLGKLQEKLGRNEEGLGK
jgi:CRP-like cAMP-binding protein